MPQRKRILPGRPGLWLTNCAGKSTITEMKLGDIVRLRKAHPCGGYEWEVVRIGAHIGIKCLKCQRKVLLEKGVFQRRLEDVVGRND
jgi:hypothetical protein